MKFAIHFSFAFLFVFSIAKAQSTFTRISCNSNITLNITQGDSSNYTDNGSNSTDVEKVVFEVYNNTLHINGGNYRNAVANITVKELKGINLNGAAKLKCTNAIKSNDLKLQFNGASKAQLIIDVNNLTLEVDGASQVELQGRCEIGDIEINGASKVFAKECVFNKCTISADGASQCTLDSVSNDLKVSVNGASKIYLKNIPEVYVATRSGLGRIYEKSETPDSTMQIETSIVLNDDKEDSVDEHPKYNHRGGDVEFNWSGLNLGFNGLLNSNNTLKAPAGYEYLDINNASSFHIGLNILEKDFRIYKRYVMGMVGAGFSWDNYKFTTPYVLQPYQPTLTAKIDSNHTYSLNKLRVSYFNIPVLLGFNTSQYEKRAFQVALGVVVGLRMGAMVKTNTENQNSKQHEKTFALFNTDQVRYDATIRLKYRWANIWATYSLTSLFRKNQGPEVHPVAIGLNIIEF